MLSVFLMLVLAPDGSAAQTTTRVAIVPYNFSGNLPEGLTSRLPEQIRDALNRYEKVYFTSEVLTKEEYGNCIKEDRKKCPEPFHYYVLLDVGLKEDMLASTISVMSKERKESFRFQVKDEFNAEKPLVHHIVSHLIMKWAMNIRVAIFGFLMVGVETEKYGHLGRLLSNMLTEGLYLSPAITLIDSITEAERNSLIRATDKGLAEFDRNSALELGKILHANYIVYGEYGDLSGKLRIDARCINRETREIVVATGITVSPELGEIEKEMAVLAAEMRDAIQIDYAEQAQRLKYIALTGYPPDPKSKENQETLLEIIRVTGRKLRALNPKGKEGGELRFVEDLHRVRTHLETRRARWLMSTELEADVLLVFQLDRTRRDRLNLVVERFDPYYVEEFDNHGFSATPGDVNRALDDAIKKFREKKWITYSDDAESALNKHKYRGLYKQRAFRFLAGPSIRSDPALFLDVGGGVMLDFGLVWNPFQSLKWQIEPMHLRFDFFATKAGGDELVIGADLLFATLTYRFRPHYEKNPYAGVSFGYLGVYRDAPGDANYDARLGAGLAVGLEHTISSARKIHYRVEFTQAFNEINEKNLAGRLFEGGRPGGIYLLIGMEF